jgi:hypothetical protein
LIGREIGVKASDYSAWYTFSSEDAMRYKIKPILTRYGSLIKTLTALYPEFPWDQKKFTVTPDAAHQAVKIIRMALDYVEDELKIEKPEDWYRVSAQQLKKLKVHLILTKNRTLFETLKKYRPNYDWDENKFPKRRGRTPVASKTS